MFRKHRVAALHLLLALIFSWPSIIHAQQTANLAIDYYVGRAVKDAGVLSEQVTFDNASRTVVAFFYRVQSNQDGVVTAQDTLDYILSFTAFQNHRANKDFAKYDLNQDGVATQNELEISISKKAWVTASVVYAETRSPHAVEERFWQLIAERTMRLRERAGVEANVNIEANGDSFSQREDLQKTLDTNSSWGPPYFVFFDANSNLEVDFEEFTGPVFSFFLAADTDGDGVLSIDEQNAAASAHEIADKALYGITGVYSFPDPR